MHFTLGRLYLRTGSAEKAVDALTRVVSRIPARCRPGWRWRRRTPSTRICRQAIDTLELIVDDEPRVAAALGQYQEQAGLLREAAAIYTKALEVQPMSRELKSRRIAALFGAQDLPAAAAFAADAQRQHPEDARFPRLGRARCSTAAPSDGAVRVGGRGADVPQDSNDAVPARRHLQ